MITILTDPIPVGWWRLIEFCKKKVRSVRYKIKPPIYNYGEYRGHYAVTRSLVEGLGKLKLPFNYNPVKLNGLSSTVVVLAGVSTLKQAIFLKRRGLISKLFAGPNIVVFSSDHDSLLASPEIDAVITPCDWVSKVYIEDNATLAGRCLAWPAGVDTNYWKPSIAPPIRHVLFFEKQNKGDVGPIEPYLTYVKHRGYTVQVIRYGSFVHSDYLKELHKAILMVGFVIDESQGIAWAEAWATNTPTLIWRNEHNIYRGKAYVTSTAPYLCDANGLFFDDIADFKSKFSYWEKNQNSFKPREWVLSNMSDEVCAHNLYTKVQDC